MPPRREPRSKTGFHGIRLRQSGRYAVELTCDAERQWIGTFDTAELAARAFDIACWRLGRSKHEMNFPEVESRGVVVFIGPEVNIVSRKEKRETRIILDQVNTHESDETDMVRFAAENLHLVQAEYILGAAQQGGDEGGQG